jgi:hypothetical protein
LSPSRLPFSRRLWRAGAFAAEHRQPVPVPSRHVGTTGLES